jgi:hypothetical protein
MSTDENSFMIKTVGHPLVATVLSVIILIVLLWAGFCLNSKLRITQIELASCKSSMSSSG